MALAAGLAAAAAAVSGIALGTACSSELRRLQAQAQAGKGDPSLAIAAAVAAATRAAETEGSGRKGSKIRPNADEVIPFKRDRTGEDEEAEAGWQGFSMEEARALADQQQLQRGKLSPHEVLAELQRGNARFWMNVAKRPERTAFERRGLISKQFPSVAVLGCSDSRVPTEIVFDQGLGDLFVIRVAGNCLDTATLASLQYAVHHLKVKVVVVLGHEMCGAVKAAQLPHEKLEQEPSELEQALKNIKVGLDQNRLTQIQDVRALDREAVCTNVRCQVERLTRDKGIMTKVRGDELLVVGAFYEISSGIVDFFHEVARGDANDAASPFRRAPSMGVKTVFDPSA